jgi:hypothetical protein
MGEATADCLIVRAERRSMVAKRRKPLTSRSAVRKITATRIRRAMPFCSPACLFTAIVRYLLTTITDCADKRVDMFVS